MKKSKSYFTPTPAEFQWAQGPPQVPSVPPPPPSPPPPPQLQKSKITPKSKLQFSSDETERMEKMTELKVVDQATKGATKPEFKLSDILSANVLSKGKKMLRSVHKTEEAKIKRKALIASASRHGYLPLSRGLEFLKSQGQLADITALELSGTEQLTDTFIYLLLVKGVEFRMLSRISLNGCFNLTDTGIDWLTEAFKGVKHVELSGCKILTEKSLWMITERWGEKIAQISMQGTNVGLIPPGYEGSIKLNGCPLLSPTYKLYKDLSVKISEKMTRPYYASQSFKIVIMMDDILEWSPMAIILSEQSIKNQKLFRVCKLTSKLDDENRYSVFEIPTKTGFGEVVLSEGSIVMLPYMIHGTDIDFDYAEEIGMTLSKLITKYPQCVFVLVGMSEEEGMDKTASRYGNVIFGILDTRTRNMKRQINDSIESNTRLERLNYIHQKVLTTGLEKSAQLDQTSQNRNERLILQAFVCVTKNPVEAIRVVAKEASECLMKRYPWMFLRFQEDLKNTFYELERLNVDFTSIEKINDMKTPETSFLRVKFSDSGSNLIYAQKVFSLMHTWGRALYYPAVEGGPVITNFTFLETIYNAVNANKGPSKASWRFLGNSVPCWTQNDLKNLCKDENLVPLLIKFLEYHGILFKLPRDCWTTELQDTYAYVTNSSFPFYPVVDMEDVWPDNVPEEDSEIERYFYFHPEVTHSFFPNLLRECLAMGGVKLLWKTGVIIRKGPLTILMEMLTSHDGQPILFVGVRLLGGKSKDLNDNVSLMQWATFKIYKAIVWQTIMEQKLYAVEYIPCPKCVPSKNRYKTVNTTQMNMIHERFCRSRNISQKKIICQNDGSSIKTQPLLGPKQLDLKDLIPTHYFLGCLPSFSAHNRCMFCGNCAANGGTCPGNLKNGKTSWNCSCNTEGQMCDECGLCQRCITFLSEKYTTVYPSFQMDGSAFSLSPNGPDHQLPHELSPNYTPMLEMFLIRGAHLDIKFNIGSTYLIYNTKDGSISEYLNQKQLGTVNKPEWVCHEGFNLSVRLKFWEEDYDDMEMLFSLQSAVIHVYKCSSQSCKVSIKAHTPSSVVVYMPNLKIIQPQGFDDFGEKLHCMPADYNLLPASVEASVVKMKEAIGEALFQAGGINYSGTTVVTLPQKITMETLHTPTFDQLHHSQRPVNHLLCYTRSKISDVLVQGIAAAPESWSVYRMIHLVDSPGFSLKTEAQKEFELKGAFLLWAWHFLLKLQGRVDLPSNCKHLLQIPSEEIEHHNSTKVQTGLHELLDLGHWRLLLAIDINSILQNLSDPELLLIIAEAIKGVVGWNEDKTGLTKTVSHFNENSYIYLCPGHHASMRIEEGLTQVLPEIYGDYAKFLLSVDIPANQLTELPEDMFKSLPNLSEFDCSRNFIKEIPASVGCCKNLYSLSVPENNLTDLPDTLVNCKDLWRLDITSNMMEKIPSVVCQLTQLKKLYASGMFLTSLPEDFGNLINVEKLALNGNCLTYLPKSFGKLKSLTDLGLSGVPWYGNLKAGKTMKFDEFQKRIKVWGLDRWMKANALDPRNLFDSFDHDNNEFLDVNELSKMNSALFSMFPRFGYQGAQPPDDDTPSGFPMEILECTNLEYLSLFYQGIVTIPPEVGNLQELRILNISHNPNLLSLPAELSTISSLTRLEIVECPLLKTPPREIRAKGFATIFGYLRRMMSGSQHCRRTKLMLVGLGGAGKTSLVNSLLSKDGKSGLTQGEAITDGIDISTWTVKSGDESVTYSVWDFAGQTVYYNTHQFFLSNRAVYLLLWNVRLGHEHAGLDFWLSSISVQAPNAPIFVVGSHIDQVSKFELPVNEMKARYKQIAGFHFVSSYTGQGIKQLQDHLYEVTLQEKYMGEQIPEVWLTLEKSVINCRSTKDVIEYSDLEQMANTSGLFDKTEIYQAVQFLHELGSLQHFTTETLKSKVVVNPQWIVDVMACVVSVKNSPIKDGRLNHKDIALIWKDYPTELHDWLLHLTEAYDLTFPLEGEPVNLVPCLLPEKAPEFSIPDVEKDSPIKRNRMIYKFDYLPAGLFNRAQVRLHQLSDSAHIWKRGSYLNKNGHVALIQQTRDSELNVTVQGPRPENVLFLVHEVFEGLISESFAGVKYDFQIPCPDCLKLVIKDPHMFSASTIRRALELKAPFLQCVKYFHTISCIDLLACMPPDNHSDFDLHLVQSVRSLRDLRKDLSADVFMSYCAKNAPVERQSVIHPATVLEDLVNVGYKCWFAEVGKKFTMEEMARALTDASVIVVFISKEYVKDEECVNIFKYARVTLRKPMVVIACGDGFDWKQSKLGILLADEVYINMTRSKREMYPAKFEELLTALSKRTNKEIGVKATPSCFFSYTWVNSQRAVKLGTRSQSKAIGYGDPREIKEYLEKQGVKCWIDIERVGQNGLFDDIAEGLLSAKVVVICVSDEYAESSTCMMEFRYAANVLKLPIIIAVVGTGNKWRSMEVGVLSMNLPIVSFQEKSDTAYTRLLDMVQEQLTKSHGQSEKEPKNEKNEKNKNLSFQELFELVQRKLLRQLSSYAEQHDVGVYPRVFAVDFMKTEKEEAEKNEPERDDQANQQEDTETSGHKIHLLKRHESVDRQELSRKRSELKTLFRLQRYCVYVLCEHDEGWHNASEPLSLLADFGETMLDKFCPYLARVSAVMKYNRHLRLNYMTDEIGEDLMKWLEESPLAADPDYESIYREFREIVMDADSQKVMGKLDRCRLPNGKIMWLCKKHQNAMKVTILSTETAAINVDFDATETIELKMIDALRSGDFKEYSEKFLSSKTALRQPDGTESSKPNMYADYDLLPDRKRQLPMVTTASKVKGEPIKAAGKDEVQVMEDESKEKSEEVLNNVSDFEEKEDLFPDTKRQLPMVTASSKGKGESIKEADKDVIQEGSKMKPRESLNNIGQSDRENDDFSILDAKTVKSITALESKEIEGYSDRTFAKTAKSYGSLDTEMPGEKEVLNNFKSNESPPFQEQASAKEIPQEIKPLKSETAQIHTKNEAKAQLDYKKVPLPAIPSQSQKGTQKTKTCTVL